VTAVAPRWRWLGQPRFWIVLGLFVRIVHVLSLGNHYYFGDTVEYEQVALRMLHGVATPCCSRSRSGSAAKRTSRWRASSIC